MENQEERSKVVDWLLSLALLAAGAVIGFLYAGRMTSPEQNAAFTEQMAGNSPALTVCETQRAEAQRQTKEREAQLEMLQIGIWKQQETENRWATVLYEPDQSGQLVLGAIAMLLGAPTGIASIAQGLSGPKPRWILRGKLQPQSPQENAQYGWLDRTDGKTEGPFRAEVLK